MLPARTGILETGFWILDFSMMDLGRVKYQ
jgi:hypothetical protein